MDYSNLRSHLAQGEFQKADDETRAKLVQLAGPDASKRSWVYFSEVQVRMHVLLDSFLFSSCV